MAIEKITGLFARTRALERQIDEFLDKVVEAGLVFTKAVDIYLRQGHCGEFEDILKSIEAIEGRGDDLRRSVEFELYTYTLLPDSRGDVLRLLEGIDDLVNMYEANLFRFSIQKPDIPPAHTEGFRELTSTVVTCVEASVDGARAFFRDTKSVRDHIHKVMFHETEADRTSTRLARAIFDSDLELERKRHLAYFIEKIDLIANSAEDVADELAVFAIKRQI